MTGAEFDYEHICRTCEHYSTRTRLGVKQVCCALAPSLDGETFGEQRESFVACERWNPK